MLLKNTATLKCRACGKDFEATRKQITRGIKNCSHECSRAVGRKGTLEERFWSKVDKTPGHGPQGECWTWTAAIDLKMGYGKISVSSGRSDYSHRVGYRLQHGDLPDGANVLHKCDNPPCVRGEHLFLGTLAENNADMKAKGRKYHKLTEQQVAKIKRGLLQGISQQSMADEFGVNQTLVSAINRGDIWVDVLPA